MDNSTNFNIVYRLTWGALAVSIISLALFAGVEEGNSETSLVLWFIFLLLLMFVSLPLHGFILVYSLAHLIQGKGKAFIWVYLYLAIAISVSLLIANNLGAFDGIINNVAQRKRAIEEPAQVQLEQALMLRPVANIDNVREALTKGANPDAGFSNNRTPFLVLAAMRADTPVIKALLDAGADPNKRSTTVYGLSFDVSVNNPSPLDVVTFSDNKGVFDSVEVLLAAGADPAQSIMKLGACRRGDLVLFDLAKKLGASGIQDANDKNCLHHAAEANQVAFLQTLLFNPAYAGENIQELLTMSNHIGQYPLDVAISKKHYQAALVIVIAGGAANKPWSIERVLDDQLYDPDLNALKAYLLAHPPEVL